jgi:hypothetical protein
MLLLSLLACRGEEVSCGEGTKLSGTECVGIQDTASVDIEDADGDGYSVDVDCDDLNADRNPGAVEVCDGLDNNCDELVDNDASDALWWYTDEDRDGYGDLATAELTCTEPAGAVNNGDDCDDADAAFYPGAEEDCLDEADYNCDGSVGFEDQDGDGWAACEECDDRDADINPKADEVCDEVDNDCDGDTDEDAIDAGTWYDDIDGDGFGDSATEVTTCEPGADQVQDGTDCDDGDATLNPDTTWYSDDDGDGYGDANAATTSCIQPSGTVDNDEDCDDNNADTNPTTVWYLDADSDGYGVSTLTTTDCTQPTGYTNNTLDCDDTDSSVSPSGSEVCDGDDNDCDGDIDDDDSSVSGQTTWYRDLDSDGYGLSTASTDACDQPSDYVTDNTDCDDTDADINPAGAEVCDGADNDCDGDTDADDSSVTGTSTYYADGDSDGYGDAANTTTDCSVPSGYVTNDDDCDDASNATYPGASEVCDSQDNDCDSSTDEGAGQTWYLDNDSDGFGVNTTTVWICTGPSGYVSNDDDCDDTDSSINPSATETCDGEDDDCDGTIDDGVGTTFYRDADGDSYGTSSTSTTSCNSSVSGYVTDSSDCDDTDSGISPAAAEVCSDGIDQDCSGSDDSCGWTGTGYDYAAAATSNTVEGESIQVLGDWDSDGNVEIAVGDPYTYYDLTGTYAGGDGGVKIYEWDGTSLSGEAEIEGNYYGQNFGSALKEGDVDADGVTDLLVGDWYVTSGSQSRVGCSYMFLGPVTAATTYANTADRRFCGDKYDAAGSDMAVADLDGDGYDDLIIGAMGWTSTASTAYIGAAFIFHGPLTSKTGESDLETDADDYLYETTSSNATGASLENIGDMDGDGDDDLMVSGINYAYVIDDITTTDTFANEAESTITASSGGSTYVYAVKQSDGLDHNGDGYNDLVLSGGYGTDVWVINGPISGAITASSGSDAILDHTYYTRSVAAAGDVDGDGYEDVWVGSMNDYTARAAAGAAYLYYGPLSGTIYDYDADAYLLGTTVNLNFGRALDADQDINGDGINDVAISSTASKGTLYLFTGI